MKHPLRLAVVLIGGLLGFASAAQAQGEPPGRVGRLAFTEGTVSFHDDQQDGWSPAVINTPLTSGDAIWTEPGALSELSLAGTRLRLDGGTQIDMLVVDDLQTRLQVDRGRIDIKTYAFDTRTPYQVVTPRGTITLRQQGDYTIEAGTSQDATRLGVRAGAAQIQSLDGHVLTVGPGQIGEISGDAGTPQLRTTHTALPAPPAAWATRDRQVNYDLPTQYLSAGITGYEDLNSYGSWREDKQFGNVWMPRSVPSDWQPYRNGHWSYVKPWGWTWIDDEPWGYTPSHYGRWANNGNRWVWVPPQNTMQPVYSPALVAFVGGLELAQALLGGNTSVATQTSAPVGWFPLGPREVYVPSYSANRDYYHRINASDGVQAQVLERRWQAAQRRESYLAGQNSVLANQRFATVVPAEILVRSQPVARAALDVSAAQMAAVPVAPVAAPPAPTASLAVVAPAKRPNDPKVAPAPKAAVDAPAKAGAPASTPVAKTAVADMPTFGRPAAIDRPAAPGPKIATAPNTPNGQANVPARPAAAPPLVPRAGAAPPAPKPETAKVAPPAASAPATPHPQPGRETNKPEGGAHGNAASSPPAPQQRVAPHVTLPQVAMPAPQQQQPATPAPTPQAALPPTASPQALAPKSSPVEPKTTAPASVPVPASTNVDDKKNEKK
jgi:hypothetical protein